MAAASVTVEDSTRRSPTVSSTGGYANVRAAMAEHALDALVVSGSEYSGFEGAVTYLSGFQIVHRYAYVVVPADGDPFVVFPPRRATSASTGRR